MGMAVNNGCVHVFPPHLRISSCQPKGNVAIIFELFQAEAKTSHLLRRKLMGLKNILLHELLEPCACAQGFCYSANPQPAGDVGGERNSSSRAQAQ